MLIPVLVVHTASGLIRAYATLEANAAQASVCETLGSQKNRSRLWAAKKAGCAALRPIPRSTRPLVQSAVNPYSYQTRET